MGCFGGAYPHQNTPNTLFAGLRMPFRAYAIALKVWVCLQPLSSNINGDFPLLIPLF